MGQQSQPPAKSTSEQQQQQQQQQQQRLQQQGGPATRAYNLAQEAAIREYNQRMERERSWGGGTSQAVISASMITGGSGEGVRRTDRENVRHLGPGEGRSANGKGEK